MSNVAIRVEGLHKQYRLGGAQQRYKTLRDSIANAALRPFRRWRNKDHQDPVDTSLFWALKDVSFEIKAGEVVGVIGRNGAGKSTLLKVLSRITEPTSGYAEIHGRVGSLLEVGTGFHPELSGRENIYLNGAILGMKRTEVERKFDEIVSFAEVEQFVDTPVKFYSSGMYLRLAFAVAAHLDPEILLVDEVLAVGDRRFQDKCLGKMGDVARGGRTVLLVSHNMGAISSICNTCLLLDGGGLKRLGVASSIIAEYISASRDGNGPERGLSNKSAIQRVATLSPTTPEWDVSRSKEFVYSVEIPTRTNSILLKFMSFDPSGRMILFLQRRFTVDYSEDAKRHIAGITIPPVWLSAGVYGCKLRVVPQGLGTQNGYESETLYFEVTEPDTSDGPSKSLLDPIVEWDWTVA